MGGPGLEQIWNGSGTKRPIPAQLCHHVTHLYQNWQFGARIVQLAILRLPTDNKYISINIAAMPYRQQL